MNRDSDAKYNDNIEDICREHHNINIEQQQLNKKHQEFFNNISTTRANKAATNINKTINSNFQLNSFDNVSIIINPKINPNVDWANLPLVILFKIFNYLQPFERLQASSTCQSWRMVIYHSTLWPKKYLNVNLCPHKFVLNNNNKNNHIEHHNQHRQQPQTPTTTYGFHTFHLKDSYLYQQHLNHLNHLNRYNSNNYYNYNNNNFSYYNSNSSNNYNNNNRKSPSLSTSTTTNRKNFNEQLKLFIKKCSRFLHGITIYFDPNSSHNVLDLIKIIKFLSENEMAIYDHKVINSVSNGNSSDNKDNEENSIKQAAKQSSSSFYYTNCRNLRLFSIVPVTTLVRCLQDQRFMSLYSGLIEAIRFLFTKCNQLEHVSFGDLHEIIYSNDQLFEQFFKNNHLINQTLKCLHLSTIKGDVYNSNYYDYNYKYLSYNQHYNYKYNHHHQQQINCNNKSQIMKYLIYIDKFQNLQQLSLDFNLLTTNLIQSLIRIDQLKCLIINVHRFNKDYHHQSSRSPSSIADDDNNNDLNPLIWTDLAEKLPELRVTINLLHLESRNFQYIIDKLIDTDLPIRIFNAYYLEFINESAPNNITNNDQQQLLCNMIETLSIKHSMTLETFALIDYILQTNPKKHLKIVTPNVLIMLCWRCKYLSNLTVIGYETIDRDIIAMARLRGNQLQLFQFPSCCIQLTEIFTKYLYYEQTTTVNEIMINFDLSSQYAQQNFINTVSLPLKRQWKPIQMNQIPEIIITNGFLPQTTYHRTILEQKNLNCIHN